MNAELLHILTSVDPDAATPRVVVDELAPTLNIEDVRELCMAVGKMPWIHTLLIQGLTIKALPEEIGLLTGLHLLDLDRGAFEHLPATIGNLTRLKELSLSDCALRDLPDELGNLASLEWLDIGDCGHLTALPASMAGLAALKMVRVSHNERMGVHDAMRFASAAELMAWYGGRTS